MNAKPPPQQVRAIGNGAMADIIGRSFDPPKSWKDGFGSGSIKRPHGLLGHKVLLGAYMVQCRVPVGI